MALPAGAASCVGGEPQAPNLDKARVFKNTIQNNPYDLVKRAKFNHGLIADLMQALGLAGNANKVTKPGTPVAIVHEGDTILYARMAEGGEGQEFYRFGDDYYTPDGKSLERLLLRRPIHGAVISSPFGGRTHPIFGKDMPHLGIDYAAPKGTPIYAGGAGTVIFKGKHKGYGNFLKIDHGNGVVTAYGHISKYAKDLKKGVKVAQGEVVAYVGSTGYSTGPHLHYEIHLNGKAYDPLTAPIPARNRLCDTALAAFRETTQKIQDLVGKNR